MKPKAKMKLMLGRGVACIPRLRSVQELTLLLSLCVLGSVFLSYQLGSIISGVGRERRPTGGPTIDSRYACGFDGLSRVTPGEASSEQDYLKTSDVLLQALKSVEADDLLGSQFTKVVLVGDSSDQARRYLKAFEAHGVQTEIYPTTGRAEQAKCDSLALWICLGPCGQLRRKCPAEKRRKVNHIELLSEQLGERDALCNTLSTLRRHSVDNRRHWSALPLCFVLPEQTQQLTDVAGALGLAHADSSSSSWLIKPVGPQDRRRHRSRQVSTAALADSDLLHKTLSPLLDQGRVVAQQTLVRPLLASNGRPVLVRVFALVTSMVPLRAYVHQAGTAFQGTAQGKWTSDTKIRMSGKSMPLKQLWHQLDQLYGSSSGEQLWSQIKGQVAALLVAAEYEILSRSTALNSSHNFGGVIGRPAGFQLLSFEFALNATLQPFLWNVNVKPHFLASRSPAMDAVKFQILADVARILTTAHQVAAQVALALRASDASIGLMCHFCRLSHDICLTENDLSYLLQSRRERLSRGMFVQIYPSQTATQLSELLSSLDQRIQKEALSSAAAQQSSVFDVSKQHQTAQIHRLLLGMEKFYSNMDDDESKSRSGPPNSERQIREQELREVLNRNFVYEEEEIDCLQDPTALPYLRLLRVSPEQTLSPTFHPNKTEYHVDVPYDQMTVEVRARALYCHAEARLDDRLGPARPVNYTLGLGYNRISVVVVDIRHAEARVANAYVLSVFRRERTSIHEALHPHIAGRYAVCSLKQSCELVIYPKEPCGLHLEKAEESWTAMTQRLQALDICRSGHEDGRWLLPCTNCASSDSCIWSMARWAPFKCRYPEVSNTFLKTCLEGKKQLLFLGDSTNRGIMYYVLMRLNGTLGEWHRSHGIALHAQRLNRGRTAAGFAYYPQFWLPPNRRPTLARTLNQLVDSMPSLENSERTVLVVGGVQWLNLKQLSSLTATLKGLGLDNAKIIIKTFGSGFHQQTDGVHRNSVRSQQILGQTNQDIIRQARQLGMEVVDTFNMTTARFKDFMQGNCACHFHKVVSDSLTTYRVEGPVNQAYSDILLSRLCQGHRTTPT
ncbi:cadherin-like and PC-esterase domain-containing protein 1 isoform X3 [Dermacentor variabilis]|uniref:cadherin-like and PC-esterase domain-containing protein 1 isoform X3 n=1 Tax=Dermacentor variabilis TaxID=34621 RepID=UPI003F5BD30B